MTGRIELLLLASLALTACAQDTGPATQWDDQRSAVALVYHDVGDDPARPESVPPERFAEHVDYLAANGFAVWSLPRLLAALDGAEAIAPRTVTITFDAAYRSTHANAFRELLARDWPFTVFVSTRDIDTDMDGHLLDWDALRALEAAGATIGNHFRTRTSMAQPRPDESMVEWQARVREEIEAAQQRLEAEFSAPARILAWPFGEHSPPVQSLLDELGYVGMARQSGALGPASDITALPRYPITSDTDSLEQFSLKVHSRPLPVAAIDPETGVVAPAQDEVSVSFTLQAGNYRADQLRCYARDQRLVLERLEEAPLRVSVRSGEPLPVGRTTFDCMAPADDGDGWYRHSFLWMRPHADGRWYKD